MKNAHSIYCSIPLMLLSAFACAGNATGAAADSTAAAAFARPTLWEQAVHIFDLGKNLVPGKVSQKIQELDNNGRVKSETSVDISLALDAAGKIKSEILKASKDGKDITAEQRKKMDEETKKQEKEEAAAKDGKKGAKGDSDEHSQSFSLEDSPFNPDLQKSVIVKDAGRRETVDGASCACFEFSYPEKLRPGSKDKPPIIKGTAWIDESSGRPVRLEYTSDPLPKHVKNMSTSLAYGSEGDAWIVKSMAFEARASFLFIKKRFRGDIGFSDYWKHEEPKEEK